VRLNAVFQTQKETLLIILAAGMESREDTCVNNGCCQQGLRLDQENVFVIWTLLACIGSGCCVSGRYSTSRETTRAVAKVS
jgi:hypothetical protein